MSSVRDKSQGITFVYTNLYNVYKQAKGANLKAVDPKSPNPDAPLVASPFEDLKANIQQLQELHSKLHFMLKELEDLVG